MTANARTLDLPTTPATVGSRREFPLLKWEFRPDPSDRKVCTILIITITVLYLLLQNRYWVPSGDGELYAAAARSLVRGEGYRFNGQRIAITPPGWPIMMAAVMKITPYFLPLKLLAMSCMTIGMFFSYWIARRFASPKGAALCVFTAAIISHVYQGTYWLISEGSFLMFCALALLLAMQIREGKRQWWRIALMIAAVAISITIRWAGVLNAGLVVAALLDREWKPALSRTWLAAVLITAVTFGTFVGLRKALAGTKEQQLAARNDITGSGEDSGPSVAVAETTPDQTAMAGPTTTTTGPTTETTTAPVTEIVPDTGPPVSGSASQTSKAYTIFVEGSKADRFVNAGRWFSFLMWQPIRIAGSKTWMLAISYITGWIIVALLIIVVVVATIQRRWLWLALAAYTGALCMGWPNINARYFAPVAFLILLGVMLSADLLSLWTRGGWHRAVRIAAVTFFGSVILCNALCYLIEVSIARSDHFYERYETGVNAPLIAACQYMMALPDPPRDTEICVSPRYTNLGRTKSSPFSVRATFMLTSRTVITPKAKHTQPEPDDPRDAYARELRRWLRGRKVRYYLWQPEMQPWRVWHFRPDWYQQWQTGRPPRQEASDWRLYRLEGDKLIQVAYPKTRVAVTRVPGL